MIEDDVLARCARVATSSWSDAIDATGIGHVADGLAWRTGHGRATGRAVTVREDVDALGTYTTTDFAVGQVLSRGQRGDVIVVSMGGATVSSFGGLAARSAAALGFAAVVIDGGCRDVDELRSTGLAVVSRHVTPRSGKRRVRIVEIGGTVECGGAAVCAGDLVVADETGVIFVPHGDVGTVLSVAEGLSANDRRFEEALNNGATFEATAESLRHM